MSNAPKFLDLPREICNEIHGYYVSEDCYIFNHDSGKLRTPRGLVDLNLMYTCRKVADEMKGLALKSNTLSFSTIYADSQRLQAGYFNILLTRLYRARIVIFTMTGLFSPVSGTVTPPIFITTGTPELRPFMTQAILDELAHLWPQFMSPEYQFARDEWSTKRAFAVATHPDATESESRRLVDHALNLLSANVDFAPAVDRMNSTHVHLKHLYARDVLASFDTDPWTIPSKKDLTGISKDRIFRLHSSSEPDINQFKFRYSAVTATIKFFSSLFRSIHQHIRKVVLHEDHVAVAYPECHAQGLIPYCLQNPLVRFERRVNFVDSAIASCDNASQHSPNHSIPARSWSAIGIAAGRSHTLQSDYPTFRALD